MLLSTTPLSKMRHVNPEQDSLVKIKLLIESMNRSPAKLWHQLRVGAELSLRY